MNESLFFYDLETSGFNPREQRIMQFAGQRTDMQLKPIGKPENHLLKMTDDILPDPDAVLLTGITPQQTISEGMTEVEFLKIFHDQIAIPGTIFVGFNNIRFDDEFMRFLQYRNFYDAYEWHWSDGRGRWDLLDVVRMTRALRPDGIKWPFDSKGQPANQLGLLTSINKLEHANAHDALSDVLATISLAKLLKEKQPKLFEYLLNYRDKKKIAELVNRAEPFVYTSGKYANDYEKTTLAVKVVDHPKKAGALVYDLRHNPAEYLDMSASELAKLWTHFCKERPCTHICLPVKTLQYNRCPAVAPIGVFDESCQKRLDLNLSTASKHLKILLSSDNFANKLIDAVDILDKQQQIRLIDDEQDVDARLYENFISDKDKTLMMAIRAAGSDEIKNIDIKFDDSRLEGLLPLYKARNFPNSLTDEDRIVWEKFRQRRLLSGKQTSKAARYFDRLAQLASEDNITDEHKYLLEELQLYGQSVLPVDV